MVEDAIQALNNSSLMGECIKVERHDGRREQKAGLSRAKQGRRARSITEFPKYASSCEPEMEQAGLLQIPDLSGVFMRPLKPAWNVQSSETIWGLEGRKGAKR